MAGVTSTRPRSSSWTATGRSETLRLTERAWTKPTAAQVGARVAKAKARLAKHRWQPARPIAAEEDDSTHTVSAGDVVLDFGKGKPWPGSGSWDADEITVKRGGKPITTVSLAAHRKHCSTHAIDLLHVDAARGVAVIGDHIVMTGHNCDGRREQPSFTVVKLGK